MHAKAKTFVFYGRTILSFALILYLITMLDWERIKHILPKLRLEFIVPAFLLLLLSVLTASIRWSILLAKLNVRQSIIDSWRYYMISIFYGIMLPGVVGGDVVRLGLSIKKQGLAMKTILTASVVFERACGFLVILMIAALTALLLPSLLGGEQTITNLVYAFAIIITVCFIFFFGILKIAPAIWFNREKFKNRLVNSIHLLLCQFRNLSGNLLFVILLLSFLVNFLDIIGSYFLARALHINLTFYLFLLIIPLVYVLTALPISLGGLGVREGVLTFFLIKVGVMASDAVLFAFLIYLNRILVALIGGFIQFTDNKIPPQNRYESLP